MTEISHLGDSDGGAQEDGELSASREVVEELVVVDVAGLGAVLGGDPGAAAPGDEVEDEGEEDVEGHGGHPPQHPGRGEVAGSWAVASISYYGIVDCSVH